MTEVEKHEKYFNLSAVLKRWKKEVFASIREWVWKKVKWWKEKLLSKAGKEVLIKAMAQACPTHVMSCFKLLAAVCDDIKCLISNFWWSNNSNLKGMKWVS